MMLLVYQQIWYIITIYYIIYILDTLIMILCLYKDIIHIYVWFLTTAHQLHLAFVFAQPSYCHPNSSAKEEQIPGPVLRELCTPPWWLQWNLHKKLRYFLVFGSEFQRSQKVSKPHLFQVQKTDVPSKSWNLNCSDPRNVPAWLESCNLENLEPNPMLRPRR